MEKNYHSEKLSEKANLRIEDIEWICVNRPMEKHMPFWKYFNMAYGYASFPQTPDIEPHLDRYFKLNQFKVRKLQ